MQPGHAVPPAGTGNGVQLVGCKSARYHPDPSLLAVDGPILAPGAGFGRLQRHTDNPSTPSWSRQPRARTGGAGDRSRAGRDGEGATLGTEQGFPHDAVDVAQVDEVDQLVLSDGKRRAAEGLMRT